MIRRAKKYKLRNTALEEKFMREAIRLAEKAKKKGEVPIGAVVVYRGKIIGKGYNLRSEERRVGKEC